MIAQFVAVVLPILICTGIGFAWSRSAGPVDTRALVFLVANVGFPCLLLSSLDRPGLSIGMVAGVFLATALAVLAFALLGLVSLRLLRMPVRRYLPSIMLPNSGNMGIPIAYLAFGEEALVYAVAFSTLIQVGHATLGVWFASGDITPASILRNPMIYALAVALGLIALGWSLPPPLRDVTRLLGGITVPLMLVMLGLSLAGLRLHETWRPLLLSLVRVWGGFAVGYGIAAGLGMEAVAAGTFAIQCGMPTAKPPQTRTRDSSNGRQVSCRRRPASDRPSITSISGTVIPPSRRVTSRNGGGRLQPRAIRPSATARA